MKALFAGSFHPPTNGHISVLKRAAGLYDEVVAAIMVNAEKTYTISAEQRREMLEKCLTGIPNVKVVVGSGLTVNLAKELHADVLLRGVRDTADFEYEKRIAEVNRALTGIETLLMPAEDGLGSVASSLVMDVARNGGDIGPFVPPEIKQDIIDTIIKESKA